MNHGLDFIDPEAAKFYKTYIKKASFRSEIIVELFEEIKKAPKKKNVLAIGMDGFDTF